MKVPTHLEDYVSRDAMLVQCESSEKRVVGKHADRARNSDSVLMDGVDGVTREQLCCGATGHIDAHQDVLGSFGRREGAQLAAQLYPLFQLRELGTIEPLRKLRLSREYNRQHSCVVWCLDVHEQANFFEQLK
jgi:hypothetical protein